MSNEIIIGAGTEQNLSDHRVRVTEATWRMHPHFNEPYQCAFFSIQNLITGQTYDKQVFQGSWLSLDESNYLVSNVTPGERNLSGSVTLRKEE